MKTFTLILSIALLCLLTLGLLATLPASAGEPAEAHSYLPLVYGPESTPTPTLTPTPTSTPTITPTPRPQLQDGYYEANFDNGGAIWFTVENNGASALDAGFEYKNDELPWCDMWVADSYEQPAAIEDGAFNFLRFENDGSTVATYLLCDSLSPTSARCRLGDMSVEYYECGARTATVTRQ